MAIFAPEYGQPFELIGPNGARAVFNDPSDPDYVGHLSSASGLDSAEVRESTENLVEFDGASQGPNYYGARSVVLEGMIPGSGGAAVRNEKVDKLMRASAAMRSDCILKWEPSGGVPVFLTARRSQPLRVEGPWNKTFNLSLKAADPRIYSQELKYAGGDFGNVFGSSNMTVAHNAGNAETYPTYVLSGEFTNPVVTNNVGVGASVVLAGELDDPDGAVVIDTLARSVTIGKRLPPVSRTNLFAYPNFTVDPELATDNNITAAHENGRLRVTRPAGLGFAHAGVRLGTVPAAEGDQVTVAFDHRWDGASVGLPFVVLEWLNSGGSVIGFQNLQEGETQDDASTDAWGRFVTTFYDDPDAAPAGTTAARVRVGVISFLDSALAWDWLLDNVVVEVGRTDGSYFDGATAPPGFTAAWSGTPNESASTATLVVPVGLNPAFPSAPAFSLVDFTATRWAGLRPGSNIVTRSADDGGSTPQFGVVWRDAWL